jgi:hypothetical protein
MDGEIRQSQLLTTFGSGSMVDLPDRSVVISGLNYWHGQRNIITEERLRQKVNQLLQDPTGTWANIELCTPPQPYPNEDSRQHRIEAFVFPGWFLGQVEESYGPNNKYRTRPLEYWSAIRSDPKFNGKKVEWVPVRFVQACVNGHLSDIDWRGFVHEDFKTDCKQQLWLDEAGSGNDFDEIFVRCECKKRRPFSQTKLKNSRVLGDCQGEMPWRKKDKEPCIGLVLDQNTGDLRETGRAEPNRLLVRSASNAYFSHTLSVISIPDKTQELYKALNEFYEGDLEEIENLDELISTIRRKRYAKLHSFDPEAVWNAIQNRKEGVKENTEDRSIKLVELEALLQTPLEHSPEAQQNKSKDNLDFEAAKRSPDSIPVPWKPYLNQVVLVHRLREVIAQVGFTRFESSLPDVAAGELDINPRRASLGRDMKWVPTIENKGEGIFLSFDTQAVETWVKSPHAKKRNEVLEQSYLQWLDSRGIPRNNSKYPGLAYILLHTLSHLLITEIALDCGYSASAIKERIYAMVGEGYGILLFTSATGSEGSLGGLVNLGHNIENHLRRALQRGRLCSNDPICAQHDPTNMDEDRFLHGAACHGCLLIAETSCENRNEFLDRALVVNTIANTQAAFFPDHLSSL